jgi:tyrosine aminotransferase
LINNPSNPCGSCFSKEHCLEIIKVADELKIPIISDEVYYGLVYGDGVEFTSLGNLTKEVPIIVILFHLTTFSASIPFQRFIVCQDGD